MEAIEFEGQTTLIAKDQDQYKTLPAHINSDGIVTVCWKLSWKERFDMLIRGKFWHMIHTFKQPLQPILLSTDQPQCINDQIEQSKKDASSQ